jgi:uncharacterized protein YcfJ
MRGNIVAFACSAVLVAGTVGCTRPGKTTAIGSGVGGAVGAGLGAIVGNQSGNAGAGVAIGAAAGAATGALIGNAFQAQEERTASLDEAVKRQERTIQAQKSELAELRAIRSDSGYQASSQSLGATPRYRYRQPSVDLESSEVARQRARLQKRGPNPSGTSYTPVSSYYQPTVKRQAVPSSEPLARYDVRSEMAPVAKSSASSTLTPVRTESTATNVAKVAPPKPAAPKVASLPSEEITERSASGLKESDIPTAKMAAPVVQTSECKEALAERDLAIDAPENSDKLFHLRRALRLCPNNAALHHEMGKIYLAMERREDAESEFKQALSIDPSLSAAKNELSSLLKEEVQF